MTDEEKKDLESQAEALKLKLAELSKGRKDLTSLIKDLEIVGNDELKQSIDSIDINDNKSIINSLEETLKAAMKL